MRRLLTIIALLKFGLAFGQGFSYPVISKHGNDIHSFIPNHWILLDSAQGDLNKDKHKDLALIVQYQDSVAIMNNDNYTVLAKPRILIILLYNPETKQYQLVEQSNSFILNHDNPNMEEPYQGISINKGVLKIDFTIFMNSGSWGMSNNSYQFRLIGGDFALIGADYNYVDRSSGETEYRSYNFLTKKVKLSTGTIQSDKQKVVWRIVGLKALKTFKTFIQPFSWEVEKDYYL